MNKPIRIMLAEDHAVMREALCCLLNAREEFTVVGEADNGHEMLALVETAAPDVVLMDINMPVLNGIEATRQLCARYPHIKILGLSVHTEGRMVSEMLSAGAHGYVPKSCAASELYNAIHTVMDGRIYVSPEVLDDLTEARTRAASNSD